MKFKLAYLPIIIFAIAGTAYCSYYVGKELTAAIVKPSEQPFFPSGVSKGIVVCYDPMAGKPVFIPFEKFPRINNSWIELKDLDGKKVVLINLNCAVTYEPKEKE